MSTAVSTAVGPALQQR